eukprot:bmy_03707T0
MKISIGTRGTCGNQSQVRQKQERRERSKNGTQIRNLEGRGVWSGCFGKLKKGFDSLAPGKAGICPVAVRATGKLTWIGLNILDGKGCPGGSTSLLCVV